MERTQVDSIVALAADIAGKADEIDEMIVLYRKKGSDKPYGMDNGMTVEAAVFLCEQFKSWIMTCMAKTDS